MFPETPEEMLNKAIRFGFLMWAIVIFILLQGCVQAPIAPNLKIPDMTSKSCPKLTMPAIPEDVELDIKGDRINKINAGGDVILRGYARARQLLQ